MRLHILAGLIDELEKIGVSMRQAGFMQARRGTRPYRVDTLLGKSSSPGYVEPNTTSQAPELDQPPDPQLAQEEDEGDPAVGKTAEADLGTKAMQGFAEARPYVVGGLQAGVPMAVLGNIVGGRKAGIGAGLVGTGLGATNEYLKQWAEKNKRKAVAKKLLERQG